MVSCSSPKTITGEKKKRTYNKSAQKTDYPAAIKSYTKQIASNNKDVKSYVDRGNAYYAIKEYANAEKDFLKAIAIDPNFSNKVHLYAATVQRLQEKHQAAADSYSRYLETCNPEEASCERANRYQQEASFAAEAKSNPVDFNPVMLDLIINNNNSQYLPHFTIDGNKMIYTERVGRQEDLYISTLKNGVFTKGEPIKGLNTPYNEGAHTISPDGRKIIFTVCDDLRTYGSCDLFESHKTNSGWSKPKNLGKGVNTDAWDSQPSISGDGKKLYFASKRSGGAGGSDIYVATLTENGWGNVINLGTKVNSKGNDESPYIHHDNRTLYFRSNGHIGMGDYDIFLARRQSLNDDFDDVKNIGYPINSAGDEGGLYVSLDGSTGYFASDQTFFTGEVGKKGKRHLDIYSFEIPISAKPNPVTYFKAQIIDGDSGDAISASVIINELNSGAQYLSSIVNEGDEILIPMPVGENYIINVKKKGYLYHAENFTLTDQYAAAKPLEKIIKIYRIPATPAAEIIAESKPIILNNIFFETGSAVLKVESSEEINNLTNQLKENPSLKIKIIGHTDNVGNERDNHQLSEERAKAVYTAIVNGGVKKDRLAFEGKGESSPIADNETAEGRQRNRRTEFVVLGV